MGKYRTKTREEKRQEEKVLLWWLAKRVIAVIIIAVVIFFAVRTLARFLTDYDADYHEKFEEIKIGTMAQFVEEVMGEPERVSNYKVIDMMVPGFHNVKERALNSGAVHFWYYDNGVNLNYIFGFNGEWRLIFKESVSG
mgnify:CR=1 FL=1